MGLNRLERFAAVYAKQYMPEKAAQYAIDLDERLPRESNQSCQICSSISDEIPQSIVHENLLKSNKELRAAMRDILILMRRECSPVITEIELVAARFCHE